MTQEEVTTITKSLAGDNSRVILAVAPQKAGVRVATDADLQAAWRSASAATVTAWTETALATMTRGPMERAPTPGTVASPRPLPELGVTLVTFANGVEAWPKPTHFTNDQAAF